MSEINSYINAQRAYSGQLPVGMSVEHVESDLHTPLTHRKPFVSHDPLGLVAEQGLSLVTAAVVDVVVVPVPPMVVVVGGPPPFVGVTQTPSEHT